MRRLFFFILLTISLSGFAQKEEKAILIATYQFSHAADLNNLQNPIKRKMILLVGRSSCRYLSSEFHQIRKKAQPNIAAANAGGQMRVYAGVPVVPTSNSVPIINEEIMQDGSDSIMEVLTNFAGQTFLVEQPLAKINWKILPEKKKITGIDCQRARGNFGGRIYDAWFAEDLPFSWGPWKLSGLPGLILEACDSKNEVKFTLLSLGKNTDPSELISKNNRGVKTTQASLEKLKKVYLKNPAGYLQSQLPGNAPKVRMDESNKEAKGVNKVRYNSLEL